LITEVIARNVTCTTYRLVLYIGRVRAKACHETEKRTKGWILRGNDVLPRSAETSRENRPVVSREEL